MRANAFRLPPASITAMFIGTLIASALRTEALTTACACSKVRSPGRVFINGAAQAEAFSTTAHSSAAVFILRIIILLES